MDFKIIDEIINNALDEDMPQGDITTDNLILETSKSKAFLIAKEDGIISGVEVFKRVFYLLGNDVDIKFNVSDGDTIKAYDHLATLCGSTRSILKGERVSLNLIQRMSGIATITSKYVSQLSGKTKILDTRKTTPNLRYLEKMAVVHGGGTNHRYSLSDMVMLKDNHIDAAGGISKAVEIMKDKVFVKIEVEVESLEQFREALNTDCDIIMLDNMNNDLMSECVKINDGKKLLEASGNMTLDRINSVSKTGVDFISVGALTHSPKALDISLKFHDIKK